MTDISSSSSEGGVIQFDFTPTVIHSIFLDQPAVRRAFKALVPEKMSEEEFWKKYLQSKYFYGENSSFKSQKNKKEDIFSRYAKESDKDLDLGINLAKDSIDPLSVVVEPDHPEEGYTHPKDHTLDSKELNKSLSLIRSYNNHGSSILNSNTKDSTQGKRKRDEEIKKRFQDSTYLEDLDSNQSTVIPIQEEPMRYQQSNRLSKDFNELKESEEYLGVFNKEMQDWDPDSDQVQLENLSNGAFQALLEVNKASSFDASTTVQTIEEGSNSILSRGITTKTFGSQESQNHIVKRFSGSIRQQMNCCVIFGVVFQGQEVLLRKWDG
eukprot:TRINITY_DN404_c0_g1_i12.p1 TRINITY_DN404_c0_g1~~TRINITY_DN404_c0_g1_i12.p1  ORF type:complete len:324 (+),score=63.46 TRINITY_DN404_c0_g1_i12:704-1675(+)